MEHGHDLSLAAVARALEKLQHEVRAIAAAAGAEGPPPPLRSPSEQHQQEQQPHDAGGSDAMSPRSSVLRRGITLESSSEAEAEQLVRPSLYPRSHAPQPR